MNTFKLFSAAAMLTLTALTSGCASDDEVLKDNTDKGSGTPQQTITVGTESTRVAYDDETLKLTWQDDDKLVVIGYNHELNSSESAEYVLSDGAGSQKGSFTGNKIDGATEYHVYYPAASVKVDDSGNATFTFGEQMQNGNGSTDHLRNNIFLQATDVEKLSNITLAMQSSIMKFDLSNVPSEVGTLKKLIWEVETENGFKSLELAFSSEESNKVSFDGNNALTAYLAFLPEEMKVKKGGKFSVTLVGDKAYYAEKTITNGKAYVAANRYTTTINGSGIIWEQAFIIQPTIADNAGYNYDELECQIGTWDGSTQTILGSAPIVDGKAYIDADLSSYADKDIWVCIPKVVKFFHKLTSEELKSKKLTLPDKDKGSTLKSSPTIGDKKYVNDWIVALYMGVNKDGSTATDATPIYWATGNLIATKTNAKDSGTTTTAAFHIATNEELIKQGITDKPSTHYDATPIISNTDGYSDCALGSQWNLFGWGDVTGLLTTKEKKYASDFTQSGANICGDSKYDIARAQLGKNWRLPSGGEDENNESAWLADYNFSSLSPNGETVSPSDIVSDIKSKRIGRKYTYTASTGDITNTLFLPSAGWRDDKDQQWRGEKGAFWSGTTNKDDSNRAYIIDCIGTAQWWHVIRYMGCAVLPVSE